MVDDGIYISIGDLRQVLKEWFLHTTFDPIEDITTMCFSKISGKNYPIDEDFETIHQEDATKDIVKD